MRSAPFELTILGSNSAVAAHGRHPTSQVLNVNHRNYLIDCGEGTQFQIRRYKVKPSRLDTIFISHLHGDHFFGLVGLLTTLGLMQRKDPLTIIGPPLLKDIIDLQLKAGKAHMSYPLIFIGLDQNEEYVIFENDDISVHSVVMRHRIPCSGFVFTEKRRELNIKGEKIGELEMNYDEIRAVKRGEDIFRQGKRIPNAELTEAPYAQRSYAFCSDTAYHEPILDRIGGVDLLYHEATFDSQSATRADITYHATAQEAATIARKAGVEKLLIGHYSSRYEDLTILLDEARTVFPNTDLSREGETYAIEQKRLEAVSTAAHSE